METTLLTIIGLLLLFIGWMQWRHERWASAALLQLAARPRLQLYSEFFPEQPFALERHVNVQWGSYEELAPTRVLMTGGPIFPTFHTSHPPFESHGVDVSFAPTIAVT